MSRVAVLAARLAMAAMLLAGCASIPSTGPARPAQVDRPGDRGGSASVLEPVPPRSGMTAEELFEGFRIANAGFRDDFRAARGYLTREAAASWDPTQHTFIYQNPGAVKPTAGDGATVKQTGAVATPTESATATPVDRTLTLLVHPLGVVDHDGHYHVFMPGALPLQGFTQDPDDPGAWRWSAHFVVENGEWRIANPPPGVAVQTQLLPGVLSRYSVWFATPSDGGHSEQQVLVPDPVELSSEGDNLLTDLTMRLLAGPSPALAGAVDSGFPARTALRNGPVRLESGVAVVDLTGAVLSASERQRDLIGAQLVATLTQVPGVQSVRLTADGSSLLSDAPLSKTSSGFGAYDPDVRGDEQGSRILLAVRDGQLQSILSPGDKPKPYNAFGKSPPPLRRPAISPDGDRLAALTGTTAAPQLLVARNNGLGRVVPVQREGGFAPPGFDRRGVLWTVGLADRRVLAMGYSDKAPYVVAAPPGIDGNVIQVEPSPDGARVALVVEDHVGTKPVDDVYVAAVLRPSFLGGELSLGPAEPVFNGSAVGNVVVDLAWSNSGTVVVLGKDDPANRVVVRVGVGQPSVAANALVANATSVAARPEAPDDVVVVGGGAPVKLLQKVDAKGSVSVYSHGERLTDPAFRG